VNLSSSLYSLLRSVRARILGSCAFAGRGRGGEGGVAGREPVERFSFIVPICRHLKFGSTIARASSFSGYTGQVSSVSTVNNCLVIVSLAFSGR
jgi:hypothetical protein